VPISEEIKVRFPPMSGPRAVPGRMARQGCAGRSGLDSAGLAIVRFGSEVKSALRKWSWVQSVKRDKTTGEWNVTSQDKKIADSSILKLIGGCVIYENYSQADGYSGKSFNFYDQALKKWRQTWVDAGGNVTDLVGELKDGA